MPEPTPIYFNTAGCGLISAAATAAGAALYRGFEKNAAAASEYWRDVSSLQIREQIAAFMDAQKEQIALVPNFSYAMNAVVQSLKGDEKVLLYKKDFPSVFIPFIIHQFDVTWIDDENDFFIDLDTIKTVIREKNINLVAISHVQWMSGFKLDIKALCTFCRENNVRTIIDGTQSLGAFDISMQDLQPDVFIASSYKWLNAGFGTGVLYMNPDFGKNFPPKVSGAHSSSFSYADNQFQFNTSVSNYEPGSVDMFGFSVLNKSIEEKMATGMPAITQHNTTLTQQFLDGLSGLPVQVIGGGSTTNRSSIVVLKDENGLAAQLAKNNIVITARHGKVRVSFHYYNTGAEVDLLITFLKNFLINKI